MKSKLLRALPLAALILLTACQSTGSYPVSELERQYLQGCATNPPENPACGHH